MRDAALAGALFTSLVAGPPGSTAGAAPADGLEMAVMRRWKPTVAQQRELTAAMRAVGIHSEADMEAWLERVEGVVSNGLKVVRAGIDTDGRQLWRVVRADGGAIK